MNWIGVLSVAGAFINLLMVGTLFLWGSIVIYVISYLRLQGQENIDLNIGGAVFPFMMLFIGIGMLFAVPILEFFQNSKKFFGLFTIICPLLTLISSYITNFYLFIFIYGILNGFFYGIIYVAVLFIGFQHFPNHRGKVSGISLCGQGLGQFVYSFLAKAVLNPDNLKPIVSNGSSVKYFQGEVEEVALRVPELLRWMALIFFIKMNIANLLINLPSDFNLKYYLLELKKKGLRQLWINILNEENFIKKTLQKKKQSKQVNEIDNNQKIQIQVFENRVKYSTQEANQLESRLDQIPYVFGDQDNQFIEWENLGDNHVEKEKIHIFEKYPRQCPSKKFVFKTKIYYLVILMGMNAAGPGLFLSAQFKSYYQIKTSDDEYLITVGMIASLGNGLLRFPWGFLLDIFTPKQVLIFISTINAILFATLEIVSSNKAAFLIYNFVIMGLFGGALSLMPVLFAKIFGLGIGSKVFGSFWIGLSLANFFQYLVVVILQPKIGYVGIFWIYFVISVFNVFLVIIVPLQQDWSQQIKQYHEQQKQRFKRLYQ